MIELAKQAGFNVDGKKLLLWDKGEIVIDPETNKTVAEGLKSLIHIARSSVLDEVIELCENYEFNVQSLIRRIKDLK